MKKITKNKASVFILIAGIVLLAAGVFVIGGFGKAQAQADTSAIVLPQWAWNDLKALATEAIGALKGREVPQEVPQEVLQEVEEDFSLGAVSGPSIDFPSWEVNGVKRHFLSQTMQTASTTLCSIDTGSATTTLLSFGAFFDLVPTSTESAIDLATSTIPNATTTALFGAQNLVLTSAAGATTSQRFLWTEANTTTGFVYRELPPNTRLAVGLGGLTDADLGRGAVQATSSTLIVTTGHCEAVLYE